MKVPSAGELVLRGVGRKKFHWSNQVALEEHVKSLCDQNPVEEKMITNVDFQQTVTEKHKQTCYRRPTWYKSEWKQKKECKTKQNKTKQKTKQNKTKQNKTNNV